MNIMRIWIKGCETIVLFIISSEVLKYFTNFTNYNTGRWNNVVITYSLKQYTIFYCQIFRSWCLTPHNVHLTIRCRLAELEIISAFLVSCGNFDIISSKKAVVVQLRECCLYTYLSNKKTKKLKEVIAKSFFWSYRF